MRGYLNRLEARLFGFATVENAFFALFLFLCTTLWLGIFVLDKWVVEETKEAKIQTLSFTIPTPAAYPMTRLSLGEETFSPKLSAHSAIILDNDSKVVIFAKNKNLRFSMASTTKIMTALVALEYFNLYDVLTIQTEPDGVSGTTVGFQKSEQLFFEDLLFAMLLPSGNDAAEAIAQNYKGGEKAFVEKMNEKVKDLHLFHTHYTDSSGLNDDGDYTTALDLAHLASYALKHPVLSRIVATKQKVITSLNGNVYTLTNLNKLLGENGVYGMKTGFTDEAGGVLVTLKKEGGRTFILVVMKSEDRFADTEALLSLISGKTKFESVRP